MRKMILFFLLFVFWAGSIFAQTLQTNPDSIPFAPAVNYNAGPGPRSIFCADLDGDADLDLAVADYFVEDFAVLKNNGDGTFQDIVSYHCARSPVSLFCADLDGDGDLDVAVAGSNFI